MSKEFYLVAVDGSEHAGRAAALAVADAKVTGAAVCLLNVVNWGGYQLIDEAGVVTRDVVKDDIERIAKEDVLAPLAAGLDAGNVTVDAEYRWGVPAEVLQQVAAEKSATKIYAGRRGTSQFVDLIVGSVSNRLAHITDIPVVLVP